MNKIELMEIVDRLTKKTSWDDVVDCVREIVTARHDTKEITIMDEFILEKEMINKTEITKREYEKLSGGITSEIDNRKTDEKEIANEDVISQKEIRRHAEDILEKGNPLEFIKKTACQFHIGDDVLITSLICSVMCQSVLNTEEGLQPKLSGESGKGKSHCCKIIGHLIASSRFIETTVSSKALFYMDDLKSGTTIFCDDFIINEELIGIIKRAMSNYQGITKHTTVMNSKGTEMTIPSRINWWLTSVADSQGIELLNRQFQVDVDESRELDLKVHEDQKDTFETGNIHFVVNDDVLVCREIFTIIKEQPAMRVRGPFAKRIKFYDPTNRRNFNTFIDFIKSFSVLNYRQRKKDEDGRIFADIQDFNEAKKIYGSRARHQKLKLNDSDFKILETIKKWGIHTQGKFDESVCWKISVSDLQRRLNITQSGLHYKMNGKKDLPESGLLAKYKGLNSERVNEINGRRSTTKIYYVLTKFDYETLSMGCDELVYLSDK